MQLHSILRSLLLLSACLLIFPVHAQQSGKPLPEMVITDTMFQGRHIEDECETNRIETNCGKPYKESSSKTVTLEIPDFTSGDAETHVYAVTATNDKGSNTSITAPDEFGIVQYQETDWQARDSVEQPQYYLTARNLNTRETRITLDLHKVKLLPFLTSMNAVLFHTKLGDKSLLPVRAGIGRPVAGEDMLPRYQDHRVSIRGDNLTIEEILDEVYQNTGCTVVNNSERLTLASCP